MNCAMDDGISLRPFAATQRLGPSGNPFAAFSKGAGFQIRSKKQDLFEERPAKKPEERIRYSKAFLESLKAKFTDLPVDVQTSFLPCFTSGEEASDTWSSTFQPSTQAAPSQPPDEVDNKDWRARPAANLKGPAEGGRALPAPLPHPNANVGSLHKASASGKEAYKASAARISLSDEDKAVRKIKGTLNKLTPENFDRLTGQIVELVASANVLRKTIVLVFEKAVAEPTFCALYAGLCEVLSKELPDFPPTEEDEKPMTFRRVLLNTCQDEFEGVGNARLSCEEVKDPVEKESKEKEVKNRTLGNMRLIAELYKKGLVMEKIMHACMQDLLKTSKDDDLPHEDNLEAVCEVLTLSGKKLSDSPKFQKHMPAYLTRLTRYSKNNKLASRIKFMIRDVLDMKENGWVPRREKFTAKKIDEIRQEAETELGIQIRMPTTNYLTQKSGPSPQVNDAELFPTPQKFSREGDWKPVTGRHSRATAATSAPAPSPSQPAPVRQSSKKLTQEERLKKAKSMFQEFVSSNDMKEALICANEIASPDFLDALVDTGVRELLDNTKDKEQEMIVHLLCNLCKEKVFSADELVLGLKQTTDQLEDLRLDIPKAPDLCGLLLGAAVAMELVGLDSLPALCEAILGAEARRAFAEVVFTTLLSKTSRDYVERKCKSSGIKASAFLQPKANWDPPDLPSVESFLKSKNLTMVPI